MQNEFSNEVRRRSNTNDIIIDNNDIVSNNNNYHNRIDFAINNTSTSTSEYTERNNSDISSEFNLNIYRYKFTDDFIIELYNFSKVHQYDHRTDFKEAWNHWVEDNSEIVEEEVRRLVDLGYEGDVIDKMFKSARYYFRKKGTEKRAPQERRDYVTSDKDFLRTIDEHIRLNLDNEKIKPSEGFEEYCKDNIEALREEIGRLYKNGIKNHKEIQNKIKKTYKNRYFLITNKHK
jgi:hypothetical protein